MDLLPQYLDATDSQSWTRGGCSVNAQVPFQVKTGGCPPPVERYLNRAAKPSRPFQISIISSFGIFIAAAAAALSNLSISDGFLSGVSNCEVSTREVRLGHSQEDLRASKK